MVLPVRFKGSLAKGVVGIWLAMSDAKLDVLRLRPNHYSARRTWQAMSLQLFLPINS